MKEETKEKIISISKAILVTVGAVGLITIGAVMGNAVQLLKYTPLGGKRSKIKIYEMNKNIKRLLERGLIEIKEDQTHKFLKITPKGKKLLLKYELEGLSQNKPPKWDKKYRVIIFDISEMRRKDRDKLRRIIRGFGFICLQNSVWVYPYHCQEIIELLKKYLELKGEVIYMTVDSIENDDWLLKSFKLKRGLFR
ncbi:MAG: CRISPR-associated endonuclease Cas2 [Patescibacteria group bacterium]